MYKATVLYYSRLSRDDLRLKRLTEVVGPDCQLMDAASLASALDLAPDHSLCVMSTAATLEQCLSHSPDPRVMVKHLRRKSRFLFVCGLVPGLASEGTLAFLADEHLTFQQASPLSGSCYEVASSLRDITHEFSALCFGSVQQDVDHPFACRGNGDSLQPLISIAGLPLFAMLQLDGCTCFFLACSQVADVDALAPGGLDVSSHFSRLLPAMMFLKFALPSQCWHSTTSLANLIIDDPLLKPSYGHFSYSDLTAAMDDAGFATTIAFIPWNYKRSKAGIARLFRERCQHLSLCVHGCDHTAAEFALTDLAELNRKLQLSIARMNEHTVSTGVPYCRVMVFPQGRFSPEALSALKANNYLAAANSTPVASGSADWKLRVSDYLQPAITAYGGVALFIRRRPERVQDFAFDLFCGKPLLLAEHHGLFRNGCNKLLGIIERINSWPRLKWSPLQEVMEQSYVCKEGRRNSTLCRLYSAATRVRNPHSSDRTFIFAKDHAADVPVSQVCVNGKAADTEQADGAIRFAATIPPHESARITVEYKNVLPVATAPRLLAAGRVCARRMLSEFRDNVISKHCCLGRVH